MIQMMKYKWLSRGIFFAATVLFCGVACAFPEGTFVCGSGDTTNEMSISKVTVGAETVPFLKVSIQRPELVSNLSGVGLLIEITDKKSGDVERRLKLPGSNIDISYTKDDEISLATSASRCRRK
jgi:hypothetical protein